jgi:hypothetical protein
MDFARHAVEGSRGNEAGVLADAAHVLACFGEDIDAMTALEEEAARARQDPLLDLPPPWPIAQPHRRAIAIDLGGVLRPTLTRTRQRASCSR